MTKVVPIAKKDLESAIQLSDETFRDSEQFSMGKAFPFIFSETMAGQSYGAFDKDKLVAFLGLVPSVIRVGPARLNVFSLGSVCTHPDYRGRGIASAVLQEVIKHIERAQGSLLLVSGTRSLYTRMNCHLFGRVTRFTLNSESVDDLLQQGASEDVKIRELEAADWLGIAEVAATRVARYEQSVWDLAALVKAEAYASCIKLHHQVLVAENDGQMTGFLVFGTPYHPDQKRQPLAFEWAGDARVVVSLLAEAVQRYDLAQLEVPVSWHEHQLIDSLRSLPAQEERNLGTVRIMQPERLFLQLRPYLEEKAPQLASRLNVRSSENGRVEVDVDGEKDVMTSDEFVSLVFDPTPQVERNEALEQLFPIPFPYTGGLNYV